MDALAAARATHAKHHKSVVVVIKRFGDDIGLGTGFIVKSTKTKFRCSKYKRNRIVVMTCQHNIAGGESLHIRLPGSSREYKAQKLHEDEESDLAVIDAIIPRKHPILEFRETSSDVGIGSPVFLAAYYNPIPEIFKAVAICLNPTVYPGKISGPLAECRVNPIMTSVVHSCRSKSGCSGGPLIFESQAIGVHFETTEQMEFARSSETVNLIMKRWLHIADDIDRTIHEMIQRL